MAMENSDCNKKEKVDAKNSDFEFSKKQIDIISDMISDRVWGTTKTKEKNELADNYVYNLAKDFFENCNNKENVPSNLPNVVSYKLDNNRIDDSTFEKIVDCAPAGNCDKNSIITYNRVSLDKLKKLKDYKNILKLLGDSSTSTAFSFEIIKNENEYILNIWTD